MVENLDLIYAKIWLLIELPSAFMFPNRAWFHEALTAKLGKKP